MFMIVVATAALGAGSGWAFHSVLPAKTWASVITGTEAAPPATPATATKAVPAESAQNIIRIDGERSELRLDGKDTGLHADKDGVSLRTPFGKFELRR
jgi:hypothetical protein